MIKMMNWKGAITVLRFELTRSITASRVAVWLVLALFPPAIVTIMFWGNYRIRDPLIEFGMPLFVLSPQVMCLLGLLLWASPVVQSELEGKTWIYLASRPGGKTALLLGKYLTAVIWTAMACLVGLVMVTGVATSSGGVDEPIRLIIVFSILIVLASIGYGALYVFIGAIFQRRAMVVCVAYTMVSEFVVTWLPAVIHQFTFAYHLRSLMTTWMGWHVHVDARPIFGEEPFWQHLLIMMGIAMSLLVITDVVLHKREYITAEET